MSPAYFLDEMQFEEGEILLAEYNKDYQNGWEQTRWSAFVTACAMGAKLKKPTDLIVFNWEKTETPESRKLTPVELEEMKKEMSSSFENFINGKGEVWTPDLVLKA